MGRAPAEARRSQSEKETRQLRYSKLVRSDQSNRGNLTDRWGAYFPRLQGGWDGPNLDGGARDGILCRSHQVDQSKARLCPEAFLDRARKVRLWITYAKSS
jgi:hypothetical protein